MPVREYPDSLREMDGTVRESGSALRMSRVTLPRVMGGSRATGTALSEYWRRLCRDLEGPIPSPGAPLRALDADAMQAAAFVKRNWTAAKVKNGAPLPGLRTILREGLVEELTELRVVLNEASADVRGAPRKRPAPLREALAAKRDLRARLEWAARDRKDAKALSQLARLDRVHRRRRSQDAVAAALHDYAAAVDSHRKLLGELFEPALVAEARRLAALLREQSSPDLRERTQAIDLRNRLVVLLRHRLAEVRRAARALYHREPSLIRRATSAYERKRKAQWEKKRRGKAAAKRPEKWTKRPSR